VGNSSPSRDQRIGQRAALRVRAADGVALVEQDIGDGAHSGAGDADNMVVCHMLWTTNLRPPRPAPDDGLFGGAPPAISRDSGAGE